MLFRRFSVEEALLVPQKREKGDNGENMQNDEAEQRGEAERRGIEEA